VGLVITSVTKLRPTDQSVNVTDRVAGRFATSGIQQRWLKSIVVLCLIAACCSSVALANEEKAEPPQGEATGYVLTDPAPASKGSLILGTASIPDYMGSDDYHLVPMIISKFSLADANVIFEGTGARINVLDHPVLEFGPAFNFSLPRESVQSNRVDNVGNLEGALELGAYTGFVLPYGSLPEGEINGYLVARQAVAGDESGATLVGLIEYFYAVKYFLRLGVNVSTTFADSGYMQTHFGVSPRASTLSGLPAYSPGSGLKDVSVSAYSILSFSRRWGLFGRVLASRLVDDAARSPLVTEEGSVDQYFGGLGLFINFY